MAPLFAKRVTGSPELVRGIDEGLAVQLALGRVQARVRRQDRGQIVGDLGGTDGDGDAAHLVTVLMQPIAQ